MAARKLRMRMAYRGCSVGSFTAVLKAYLYRDGTAGSRGALNEHRAGECITSNALVIELAQLANSLILKGWRGSTQLLLSGKHMEHVVIRKGVRIT